VIFAASDPRAMLAQPPTMTTRAGCLTHSSDPHPGQGDCRFSRSLATFAHPPLSKTSPGRERTEVRDLSARRYFFSAAPQNFEVWRQKSRQTLRTLTWRFAPSSPIRERFLPRLLAKIDSLQGEGIRKDPLSLDDSILKHSNSVLNFLRNLLRSVSLFLNFNPLPLLNFNLFSVLNINSLSATREINFNSLSLTRERVRVSANYRRSLLPRIIVMLLGIVLTGCDPRRFPGSTFRT